MTIEGQLDVLTRNHRNICILLTCCWWQYGIWQLLNFLSTCSIFLMTMYLDTMTLFSEKFCLGNWIWVEIRFIVIFLSLYIRLLLKHFSLSRKFKTNKYSCVCMAFKNIFRCLLLDFQIFINLLFIKVCYLIFVR